jgi:hypothetical protein
MSATPQLVPSIEELSILTEALGNFLAKYDFSAPFVQDPSVNPFAFMCARQPLLVCLGRLNSVLNPEGKQPGDWGIAACAGWSRQVFIGLQALKDLVPRIIGRWDVPELWEDHPVFVLGPFEPSDSQTPGEKARRPFRPLTLTANERTKLASILAAFTQALEDVAPRGGTEPAPHVPDWSQAVRCRVTALWRSHFKGEGSAGERTLKRLKASGDIKAYRRSPSGFFEVIMPDDITREQLIKDLEKDKAKRKRRKNVAKRGKNVAKRGKTLSK